MVCTNLFRGIISISEGKMIVRKIFSLLSNSAGKYIGTTSENQLSKFLNRKFYSYYWLLLYRMDKFGWLIDYNNFRHKKKTKNFLSSSIFHPIVITMTHVYTAVIPREFSFILIFPYRFPKLYAIAAIDFSCIVVLCTKLHTNYWIIETDAIVKTIGKSGYFIRRDGTMTEMFWGVIHSK